LYNHLYFRYSNPESDIPSEIALIDLQGTQVGRLGIELAYFMVSSTSPKQRVEHLDSLFHHYYDSLSAELKSLGYVDGPPFTFDEMVQDFEACYVFGFGSGCQHTLVSPVK